MKYCIYTIGLIVLLFCSKSEVTAQEMYKVDEQKINLSMMLDLSGSSFEKVIEAFEMSEFVTLKDYKEYLLSAKIDSSQQFYHSQLPDSSIFLSKAVYERYVTEEVFESYPVLGISWDNAMNYCKWKSIQDNRGSELEFIYRLPHCSEWLAAFNHFEENNIENDLDSLYADWLLGSAFGNLESAQSKSDTTFYYDIVYMNHLSQNEMLSRKLVIGDSYLYEEEQFFANFFFYYSFEGYRHIAFRLVKEKVEDPSNNVYINKWRLDK